MFHDHELGDGKDLGGQRERGQKNRKHDLPASELEPRERVGGQDAYQRRPYHYGARHQDRIEDIVSERRAIEQCPVTAQGHVPWEPHRRKVELVCWQLDGLEHYPRHREQHEHADQHHDQREDPPPHVDGGSTATPGCSGEDDNCWGGTHGRRHA